MDIKAAAVVKKERGDRCSGSSRDFFLNVKKSGENIHMQTWYSELNIYMTLCFLNVKTASQKNKTRPVSHNCSGMH